MRLLSAVSMDYPPTETEIARARTFQTPSIGWGYQARQERDLRLFAIGGSNTRNSYYSEAILNRFAKNETHPNWTASMHRFGIGGLHSVDLLGNKLSFESWNHSQWPNVIMLEFAANIETWNKTTAMQSVDLIVCMLRKKYSVVHLPEPDIMFLELFNVRSLLEGLITSPNATREHKLNQLESVSDLNLCNTILSTKCSNYFAMRHLAAYYEYPVVSWRELAYNAFVRCYLTVNETFTRSPWLHHNDGMHISRAGGQLLYQTLLGPFFDEIMTPRNESPWQIGKTNLIPKQRMFAPVNLSLDLFAFSFTGLNISQFVRQPTEWRLMKFHEVENFICSSQQSAPLHLSIDIPAECDQVDTCSVSVGFLHSWNTSHVGNLRCELYSPSHKLLGSVLVNTTLDEDGAVMHHTARVRTNLRVHGAGTYGLNCSKLDSRLTCFTSFAARSIMEV